MNKFFKVDFALAAKEVGKVFHQVQDFELNENYDENNRNLFNDAELSKYIDYKINIPYFVLHKSAILSDLVSSAGLRPNLILISPKLLSLLQKFKIDDYQTFKVKVKVKTSEGLKDYFLFFMYAPDREAEYVDWTATTFRIKPYLNASMYEYENDQIIKFENKQDYLKLRMEFFRMPKQEQEVVLTNLKLRNGLIDRDMFRFGGMSLSFFVSEALKNEIEKQCITGIRFVDADGLREPYHQPQGV